MLSVYDLYDLHAVFVNIREFPGYELNDEVISKIITVLEDRCNNHDINKFRIVLSSIKSLEKEELYKFLCVENIYTYNPSPLKNENTYEVLVDCCKFLLKAVQEDNNDKIKDLADCLHNLPIMITENIITTNNGSIPKNYWKYEVKYYRNKWDKLFLKRFK